MREVLARFVAAFRRGIEGEIAAMQASAAASEVALTHGEELGGLRYAFQAATTDGLGRGVVGTLRTASGQYGVTVESVEGARITILATPPIDLAAAPITLDLAPWFLYERLFAGARHAARRAPRRRPRPRPSASTPTRSATATVLRADHSGLDASQRAAVQLCSDKVLAKLAPRAWFTSSGQ